MPRRFPDLVRGLTEIIGTGAIAISAPIAGFTPFSAAGLATGDTFYYSVIGLDKPAEREVGIGTYQADGTIARTVVLTGGGLPTNFTAGLKTIAATVAGQWFADADAAIGTIASKEPAIAVGTVGQYWRGDKSWQTLNKAAVGLAAVDNTSDADKPISTATAAALAAKQPLDQQLTDLAGLVYTGNALEVVRVNAAANGFETVGLVKADVGLSNVDNVQQQPLDPFLTNIADLTDPNADRLLFWDDSAGAIGWLTLGTNLTITGTTLDATGGGGVTDGDKGDVVVSSGGTVWTVESAAGNFSVGGVLDVSGRVKADYLDLMEAGVVTGRIDASGGLVLDGDRIQLRSFSGTLRADFTSTGAEIIGSISATSHLLITGGSFGSGAAAGQGKAYANATEGLVFTGNGTGADITFTDRNGAARLTIVNGSGAKAQGFGITGGSFDVGLTAGKGHLYSDATDGLVLSGYGSSGDITLLTRTGALIARASSTGLAVTGVTTATGKITGAGIQSSDGNFRRADGSVVLNDSGAFTHIYGIGHGVFRFVSGDQSQVHDFSISNTDGRGTFGKDILVPAEAFAAGWNGSNEVPTKDAVYDALAAAEVAYRTILDNSGSHTAGRVAGTYAFGQGQPLAVSGTGTLYPLDIIYLDPNDYPAIGPLTAKLRIRCVLSVNDVAPTGNYTVGLHPVTRPGTSGGAGLAIHTIGAAVSGSTAVQNTPAADSINNMVGADFAVPAAGFYCVGLVTSATVAASSHLHLSALLQLHYS